jgi:hypothetical protein
MLPVGGGDVRDEFTSPGGQQSASQGQYCPTCGRFEPDPWARFCGACGGTLDAPGADATDPGVATTGRQPAVATPPIPPAQHYAATYPAPAASPGTAAQRVIYRIPSVGLGGSARMGAAVVAAFSLIHCLGMAFVASWLIHAARTLLESWQAATVQIPAVVTSVNLRMNFVDLLQLRPILDVLRYWDDRLWLTFAIFWLVPWFAFILGGAIFAVILAVIYNIVGSMGGGLRVTVSPEEAAAPQDWTGGQPMAPSWPVEGRR